MNFTCLYHCGDLPRSQWVECNNGAFLFFCCGFESFEKLLFMCLTVVLDSGQRFIRLIVYCPCVTRKEFLSNVNQETSK